MVMKILILIFVFEIKESKITNTLVKKKSRLDVRREYSFSQRTINVLKNLSTDCVHASSFQKLKNILRRTKLIRVIMFTTKIGH